MTKKIVKRKFISLELRDVAELLFKDNPKELQMVESVHISSNGGDQSTEFKLDNSDIRITFEVEIK